jgi:hypothetical protein
MVDYTRLLLVLVGIENKGFLGRNHTEQTGQNKTVRKRQDKSLE